MQVEIDESAQTLTLTLPLSPGPSKSGKTFVIASTRGNQPTGKTFNGQPVIVGATAYTPKG